MKKYSDKKRVLLCSDFPWESPPGAMLFLSGKKSMEKRTAKDKLRFSLDPFPPYPLKSKYACVARARRRGKKGQWVILATRTVSHAPTVAAFPPVALFPVRYPGSGFRHPAGYHYKESTSNMCRYSAPPAGDVRRTRR